ncbi:MAG: phosphoribosyl-AMP cyclohydrolase [Syntrophales bacterium]|nr:phosphoribosyl-AMP cyclohydrolase [Syntrophales bacterium]
MIIEPDFEKAGGLVTAVVQDAATKELLMVAYMNRDAWMKTIETGNATYWSRSRNELWVKGKTSGNIQLVKEIRFDCDADAVLLLVDQKGAACHEGYRSCFFRRITGDRFDIVGERIFDPEVLYRK